MARFLSRGAAVLAVLIAGCGPAPGTDRPGTTETLRLDGPPSAEHAGMYLAMSRGYDEVEGVPLKVRTDGDPAKLLTNGEADLALMSRTALEASDAPLVGVMALRQDPLVVLVVTRDTLTDNRDEVGAVIRALQRGYTEALTDPESAVGALVDQVDGLDRAAVGAEFDRIAPSFAGGADVYGALPRGLPEEKYDGTLVGPVSRD